MRRPANKSQGLSPTMMQLLIETPSFSEAKRKMSGAGLAFSTSSPVTTGNDLGRCKPFTSFGLSALPTGGDGPRQAHLGKVLQELASAGQDSDGLYSAGEIFRV